MIRILLASHSNFANGLYETGQMIAGKEMMEDVTCLSLQPDEGVTCLEKQVEQYCTQYMGDTFLIMVDMLGATPFNVCASVFQHCDYRILSGMNLPMLIAAVIHRGQSSLEELAEYAHTAGKEGIETVQLRLQASMPTNTDEEDF